MYAKITRGKELKMPGTSIWTFSLPSLKPSDSVGLVPLSSKHSKTITSMMYTEIITEKALVNLSAVSFLGSEIGVNRTYQSQINRTFENLL